ncbi:MAG: fused MFS/spermidine synthase [Steroidobacteraceae bacterium]|nr:fused MFS/spermidine synthase [Steroidobacteraceae bacterium]
MNANRNDAAHRARWSLALMAASGAAGLGYQIVWTQQTALWLGHEAAAILAVVAAFFGGLAAGALLLGARIETSPHPARWYALCETVIGLWSLVLVFALPFFSRGPLAGIPEDATPVQHWAIAFGGTFVLLLPATAAMGATLPAMERLATSLHPAGNSIARLYAANTFGAVLGVIGAAFVLVPRVGLRVTALICVALSLTCAVGTLRVFASPGAVPLSAKSSSLDSRWPISWLAITGLLGIGYEVLVVRVLSQVAENTVYTFALLLAVYLVGTTAGAVAYGKLTAGRSPERVRDTLLGALALACLLGIAALAAAGFIKNVLLAWLGPGFLTALLIETLLAAAAFLLPTFLMGALFSHLATEARAAGIGLSRALGVNTLGAAFAPLVFGCLLLAGVGATHALLGIALGYLLLATRTAWRTVPQLAAAAAAVTVAVWSPSLAHVGAPPGGKLVSYVEGILGTVSVIEDANGIATLHINNRQQEGSNATWVADARQGLLPVLLHPAPRQALFLGLGTGVTSRAASEDPTLSVDAVELLPEVIAASKYFAPDDSPARLRIITADARRYVRVAGVQYDVIVADNFHPARSGSGTLYTVEHFEAVRDRLATVGVFCQWLPLHQLDLASLRSIVRSYLAVFPDGGALLATNSLDTPVLGLVSRRDGGRMDVEALSRRLKTIALPRAPAVYGIPDEVALLGSFIAGPISLARFAHEAPLNTDDRPFVSYEAPRLAYAMDSAPRDRLIALLQMVDVGDDELFSHSATTPRLAAYRHARDRYLEAGRHVRPTSDVHAMLRQVREPLLAVLRLSPDFRPAYDPLLGMAHELAQTDASGARALLTQLEEAHPARPEAREVLRMLDAPR